MIEIFRILLSKFNLFKSGDDRFAEVKMCIFLNEKESNRF